MAALTSTVLGLFQQSCKVSILQQDTFQVQHDPNKHLSSSFKRRAVLENVGIILQSPGFEKTKQHTRNVLEVALPGMASVNQTSRFDPNFQKTQK